MDTKCSGRHGGLRLQTLAFLLAAPSIALGGCSGGEGEAELLVELRTDFLPVHEFGQVRTTLEQDGEEIEETRRMVTFSDPTVRGFRVADFEGLTPGIYDVHVRLLEPGRDTALIERLITVSVQDRVATLAVIARDCADVRCDGPETQCLGGICVPAECEELGSEACGPAVCETASECSVATACATAVCESGVCLAEGIPGVCSAAEYCHPTRGCAPSGLMDGGGPASRDGGTDGESAGCIDSRSCDDGIVCTADTCEGGTCRFTADSSLCTDAAGGACIAGFGCEYEGCSAASCVPPDACQTAHCEGESCVLTPACGATEECCAGACVPAACDDGNACTTDACGVAGCEHMSGPGCTACMAETDCPAPPAPVPFGACEFASPCSEAGIRRRMAMVRTCDAGRCGVSSEEQTEACTRVTAGTSCGTTSYGGWGSCGGFSGACGTSGTRTRTQTDLVCDGGTCGMVSTMDSGSCSRTTNGVSCGTTTTGGWSACGGFSSTCDQTGSRTRTITTRTCGGGACGSSTSTETGSCSRSTSGLTCGSTTTGGWSACGGYSSVCDQTGTHSRTVTTRRCGGGSCGSSSSTETGSCSRNTNGTGCADLASCRLGSCSGGSCNLIGSPCTRMCCEPGVCQDPRTHCP